MLNRRFQFVKQLKQERRELGWKGVLRKRGWKLLLGFVVFYLVRDLVLYVLVPAAIYMGFTNSRSDEGEATNDPAVVEER